MGTASPPVVDRFRERFGTEPDLVVRSPGRVNLIGDHTDYNDGLALPMAIEQSVEIAARRRDDRTVRLESTAAAQALSISLDAPERPAGGWGAYVHGVVREVGEPANGWEGIVDSDLEIGAGLSSSAALELATARVIVELAGRPWDPRAMAEACRRAENDWVGVRSGVLDQMASALSRVGTAMLIDFEDLSVEHVPIPDGVCVLVLDTATRRDLVDSGYNDRRLECESVLSALGLASMRDLGPGHLPRLEEPGRRRARHVLTENEAVRATVAALGAGDLAEAGRWFRVSHQSLRDDYEASTAEVDLMVAAAETAGAAGARMTGGGFGGSVVALVDRDRAADVLDRTIANYRVRSGLPGTGFVATAAAGTSIIHHR